MKNLPWMRSLSVAALISAATGMGAGTALAYTAPYSTPAGITLVDVQSGTGSATPKFLWRRLGDDQGNPLYTYDADQAGKSSCYAECAKQFPPFVADAHAKVSGDFSILVRDDQVRQWTYEGKPLYRYSGKDPVGQPSSAGFARPDGSVFDPANKIYSPKQGWQRAAYTPEKTVAMPAAVELDAVGVANGFGFVDAGTGMAIYAVPVSHKLSSDWQPLRASVLARPVGEFSIVERKDLGTRQWTYKGEALYTYAGDYAPGEAYGIFTGDKSIQAALAYRNFMPPGVAIENYVGRGPLMTTTKGMSLYFEARFVGAHGGRDTRHGGYGITYNDAKKQGAEGCQGDCTQSWKPALAAANAQPSGFWEIVARPDGGKQWAFKGSPMYSFAGDTPGDIRGNNLSVIVYGGSQGEIVQSYAEADAHLPPPRLGKIDLGFAVGTINPDDIATAPGAGRGAPAAGAGGGGGTAAQTAAQIAANGGMREGSSGAGFYWHVVYLDF